MFIIIFEKKDSIDHVLDNIVSKWKENSTLDIDTICVSCSFLKHHIKYKDIYQKYLQFRTLHHRFFTNDKLFTIGIKQSKTCGM